MSKYNCFFVGILLAFVCHNVDSLFSQSTSVACEGNNLYLSCPSGSILSIINASYERPLPGCNDPCPRPSADRSKTSVFTNSTAILRSRCNDRENCTVAATEQRVQEYKYLTANYTCIPYKRVCEGSTMNITCPTGHNIIILSANYGRTLNGTEACQYSNPNATTNTNCSAVNATQTVGSTCNYNNTCTVKATNSQFGGDPCPGTYKYLQASYFCF